MVSGMRKIHLYTRTGKDSFLTTIPFNRAALAGNEMRYVEEAIRNGHISGNGPFTQQCELHLEELLQAEKVLLTPSCTQALEIAALLLDFQPGETFLLPAYTFVSTVNAFVLHGGTPVFTDIREDTLNMDHEEVDKFIDSRTKAIVPVHYGGVSCEMESLTASAEKHGCAIIEDNAHSLLGTYQGRLTGTFGSLSALSFHETKNITCGEGGALIINDASFIERAMILRDKGTNRERFLRGEVDKYTWEDKGSSYVLSDILAAFLLAQLEKIESIQARRKTVWQRYYEGLKDWSAANGVRLPFVPEGTESAYHLFHLIMPTPESRDKLITELNLAGIKSVFHYVPLHLSRMGIKYGGRRGQFPVAERVSERLLRLPFYNSLSHDEQDRVIEKVREFQVS